MPRFPMNPTTYASLWPHYRIAAAAAAAIDQTSRQPPKFNANPVPGTSTATHLSAFMPFDASASNSASMSVPDTIGPSMPFFQAAAAAAYAPYQLAAAAAMASSQMAELQRNLHLQRQQSSVQDEPSDQPSSTTQEPQSSQAIQSPDKSNPNVRGKKTFRRNPYSIEAILKGKDTEAEEEEEEEEEEEISGGGGDDDDDNDNNEGDDGGDRNLGFGVNPLNKKRLQSGEDAKTEREVATKRKLSLEEGQPIYAGSGSDNRQEEHGRNPETEGAFSKRVKKSRLDCTSESMRELTHIPESRVEEFNQENN